MKKLCVHVILMMRSPDNADINSNWCVTACMCNIIVATFYRSISGKRDVRMRARVRECYSEYCGCYKVYGGPAGHSHIISVYMYIDILTL